MEFMDVVRQRLCIREYAGLPVDEATMNRLVSAAEDAPCAANLRPWAIGMLLDRARIESYGQRAQKWLLNHFAQVSHDVAARQMLEDEDYSMFQNAPALTLIMARASDAQSIEDCCLAAENFILAAQDLGLQALWTGICRPWLNHPAVKKELGIPKSFQVIAPIVLGYPATAQAPAASKSRGVKMADDPVGAKRGSTSAASLGRLAYS